MYEIFELLCKKYGITPYKFCKETGINASTISTWKKNNTVARPRLANAVCEYFGVSYDYFMTGNEETEDKELTLTPVEEDDIKLHIDKVMETLNKDKLYYNGGEIRLSDENKLALRQILEAASNIAKNGTK